MIGQDCPSIATFRQRTCLDCPASLEGENPCRLRCGPCAQRRNKQHQLEWKQRHKRPGRKSPDHRTAALRAAKAYRMLTQGRTGVYICQVLEFSHPNRVWEAAGRYAKQRGLEWPAPREGATT